MSEIDDLNREIHSYYGQRDRCNADRSSIREKLNRLKNTKDSIVSLKDRTEEAKTWIQPKLKNSADTWSGRLYQSACELHSDEVVKGWNSYFNDLDSILDAICDEITRLENEDRNLGSVLNWIANQLNNLFNEIEKRTN